VKTMLNKRTQTIAPDQKLPVSQVARPGHIMHTENGQSIVLGAQIAGGGEGHVFKTNSPSYVAKVYMPEKTTTHKLAKIKKLIQKGIDFPGICLPKALLYNSKDEFVGYLMKKAEGEKVRSLYTKPLFLKKFPNWKKRDLVELCVTILKKIGYLHKNGIILGDINPDNILVKTPKDIFFVDCDSYQVDGIPCPVGVIPFTPPELQGLDHYNSCLRTVGNENFAVAVLLFSLMVTGQMPYNQKNGATAQQNIINMDFSYPLGEASNKKTPNGPWRFLWSHLPRFLKDAFYNTFNKGGKYSTESSRLSTYDWFKKFNDYLTLLDSGKFGKQDEMSELVYPTRFKKQKGITYVKCPQCREDTDESVIGKFGICLECLRKNRLRHCQKASTPRHTSGYSGTFSRSTSTHVSRSSFNTIREIINWFI